MAGSKLACRRVSGKPCGHVYRLNVMNMTLRVHRTSRRLQRDGHNIPIRIPRRGVLPATGIRCLSVKEKEVVRVFDRRRVVRRIGMVTALGGAVVLASLGAMADDPCTKLPDLWMPADGTSGLANGGISVQETTGDVCQGDTVTITVTVDNLSCGDAGPFYVTVYYDGTTHVIGTQRVDGLPGCEFTTLTFVWDTDGVPAGEHEVLACADTTGAVSELNESNNCITIEQDLLVRPNAPLIEAEKTADAEWYEPGSTVTFRVTLWNEGCDEQEDNPGHEFIDALPDGLTATGYATATSGTISVDGNTIVWDGSITAGGSVTLVFKARIDSTAEDGSDICNQGTVHWDSNGDGTNDASEPTDNPDTGAEDDPTCLTVDIGGTPPPLSGTIDAPTLSEWGAIVLVLLFVSAFVVMVRRKGLTVA